MIFVTVGTHEQQFDRIVKCIDELKKKGIVNEQVVIQTGFSNYEPQFCEWKKLFSYQEMVQYVQNARVVITHGGPSSFIMPLQIGKIPVVVPRQKNYGEHVNNHQVDFCKAVSEREKNIILVEDISELGEIINNYDTIVNEMSTEIVSNNEKFNDAFSKIIDNLMLKK